MFSLENLAKLKETAISVGRRAVNCRLVQEYGMKPRKPSKETEVYSSDEEAAPKVCTAAQTLDLCPMA